MTARIPSASAIAHACSGPAPPNATSARSRGSTPRSTVTTRTARSIAASTTRTTPSASTPRARSSARACRGATSSRPRSGNAGIGRDPAEHKIGVGHRRVLAAAAVARGTGHRARAARTDHQRAARVEPGDRAAARADGVHVERRQPDREPGDDALRGRLGNASANEAHVGARTAHVEADRIGVAARGRDVGRGAHAAGRAGQQQRGRGPRTVGDRNQTARRRHHQRLGGDRVELRRYGAHTGSRKASTTVVTMRSYSRNSGTDLVRAHDELRPDRAQRGRDRLFVRGIEIGVQQAHCDRVDLRRDVGQTPSNGSISRAVRVEPARKPRSATTAARAVRAGRRTGRRAKGGPAGRSRSRRRNPASRSARPARRAVRAARSSRSSCRARARRPVRVRVDGVDRAFDRPGRIVGRRCNLVDPTVVGDDIGERPTAVDPEAHATTLPTIPRQLREYPRQGSFAHNSCARYRRYESTTSRDCMR